ncbi:MAG: cobalamin biosynthesis protein [Methanobacteriaceae archaeon]|nr:cobalamin biosynthesis protein [Methanobacteriaceae archaeon]
MEILLIIISALFIDLLIGEPPTKIHPVVLMGNFINYFKKLLSVNNKLNNKWSGVILTFSTLIIFISFTYIILEFAKINFFIYLIAGSILLSSTFSIKLLITSIINVKNNLELDINEARNSISQLVSRDTSNLTQEEIISAAIETLTENITDSVISPLFYSFFASVFGGIFYRVVNTLDAMVGYKDPENIEIGWFPAKLDDVLNYVPARITGFLIIFSAFILQKEWKNAYKIMKRDARNTPSPNSGYSMAAAAGALNVKLIKKGVYELGNNIASLEIETISEAILLTETTIALFVIFSSVLYGLFISILTIFF